MATIPDTPDGAITARSRVTLTRDIRGVPEGTNGVVKVVNGLTWARYWVQFDNGEWVGSVSGADVVREGDYEDFKRRQAEEALRPKEEATAGIQSAAPSEAAPTGGASSRVPAHLLERSQQARARKAASGG